jgi:thiol:disulfide interchange protein
MSKHRWAAALVLALGVVATARPARAQQQPIYDPRANVRAEIQAALGEAQQDHKLILLDFGADWCLDCVILDRFFADAAVQPYLRDHYHLVRVDVGRFDHNLDVARKYGMPIEGGVPAIVVLAPTGQILVNTRDGSMEGARRMTPAIIRRNLEQWAALHR